jgi:transcription elongation GreA/GreB family factor
VALEGIFARDDVREMAGLPPGADELQAGGIWLPGVQLGPLLEQLPAAKHRRALESFKAANAEHWHEALLLALNNVSAKLCRELAGLLIQEGCLAQLKENLARLISQHTASSELLLWLARDRNDSFADILGPEVFRAMLTAMERDQFNERRSNRLRDYILEDQELLVELIGSADLEVIKDLTRALQLSASFDDMDKRSLLARIVKSYPAIKSLISGDQTKQETGLLVSWSSLERRKNEYHELVEKKIPANSKEIALARSYGDLRENHEYKAAKEMQKLLMRQKAELEVQLVRARGTDFSNPRADVAGVGTVVRATNLATLQSEQFTILGAWDSDPEKAIVSYLSPVAQSLLGHKVGDEVEFEIHNVLHRHRIESIQPWQPA